MKEGITQINLYLTQFYKIIIVSHLYIIIRFYIL